jgi:hypothetical protein
MRFMTYVRSRMRRKPLTGEELRRLSEAAAAKDDLRELKSGGRPGPGGLAQVERALEYNSRRSR